MREIGLEEQDGNVIFATDDAVDIHDEEGGTNARMFSPRDAVNWCQRRDDDLADLLVRDAGAVNLRKRPEGGFEIAPTNRIEGENNVIRGEIDRYGAIPLSDQAVDQVCGLMNRGATYNRGYGKMALAEKQFIVDFKSRFGRQLAEANEKGKPDGLIFRTSTTENGLRRSVEGVVHESADRTNENYMVRRAMFEIMRVIGQDIHGVEFVHDPERATRSFRIVFGQPNMDRSDHVVDHHGYIYPMLDITLSAVGKVTPSAQVGLYRVLCRNTAIDDLFPMVKWRGSGMLDSDGFDTDMRRMAEIAVPYCSYLAENLNPSHTRCLEGSYVDTLHRLQDLGCISKAHASLAEHYVNEEVGEIGKYPDGDGVGS